MIPRLIVERPMAPEETAAWTTCEEQACAAAFRNERRRREFLTWRTLLRRELGAAVRIGYNGVGAPVLPDGEAFVGVSHCDGRVAVCLSTRPCAVDIEPAARDFSRAADRCMTPYERLLSADPLWPGYVWCAKETLYKLAGRRELDLCTDLRILGVDLAQGWILGRIAADEPLRLSAACLDGYLVVSFMQDC